MFRYIIENNEVTITDIIDRSITEITIPETINGLPVTKIYYNTLWYNRELSNIVIPTSINTLPYYVFVNSLSLTHINNIELKYAVNIVNNKFIVCGKRSYKIIYQMCDDYYCCGLYYHYFIDEKLHNTDFGEY